jgi:methylated-DNA-[protein]-cysteine S-methyltransferase
MKHFYDLFSTPCGDFAVAVDSDNTVVATAFGGLTELRGRFDADELVRDSARTAAVRREVTEYFAGRRDTFTVPLAPGGTAFQNSVWSALRRIPSGQTRSYGQLATQLGKPFASRAVGRANATNPICLIIPCHRVIGSDGSLTGFAFGEDVKRRLLEHEGALTAVPA